MLETTYLGLKLKNPVIAGSCGLTGNLDNIKEIAAKGAGAVILKSVFEEQIRFETEEFMKSGNQKIDSWTLAFKDIINKKEYYYEEALSYISDYAKEHSLGSYLKLITDAAKAVDIPVIASINCTTAYDWQYFARRIQEAGAAALELNIYVLPSDFSRTADDVDKLYTDVIEGVKKFATIPISLKIGYYFTDLALSVKKLSETGISGLTLFNRPYNPDINIEKEEVSSSSVFSSEADYLHTLRWIAIMSGRTKCGISASSGIHNSEAVIKMLLAGANTVQIASVMYKKGFDVIPGIIKGIEEWMNKKGYKSVDDFRGKVSQARAENPASFERVQFMRLYSSIV